MKHFWRYYGIPRLHNTLATPRYDEAYYVLGWKEWSVAIPKWLHDELYHWLP